MAKVSFRPLSGNEVYRSGREEANQAQQLLGFRPLSGNEVYRLSGWRSRITRIWVSAPSRGMRFIDASDEFVLICLSDCEVSAPSRGMRFIDAIVS